MNSPNAQLKDAAEHSDCCFVCAKQAVNATALADAEESKRRTLEWKDAMEFPVIRFTGEEIQQYMTIRAETIATLVKLISIRL